MLQNNTALIIQARTGSTRLPEKMLLPFSETKGVLELLLLRLIDSGIFNPQQIIVATTDMPKDDRIVAIAESCGVSVFRGDENDVLKRFIAAAEKYNVKHIIRVCADNLFLDMEALKRLVVEAGSSNVDYMAYFTPEGIPSVKTHYGFWAEYVSFDALKKVEACAQDMLYREHVTNFIYMHPEMFSIGKIGIPDDISANRNIRLTLDTEADFKLQKEIYNSLHTSEITAEKIIAFLENTPHYYQLMKNEIEHNCK